MFTGASVRYKAMSTTFQKNGFEHGFYLFNLESGNGLKGTVKILILCLFSFANER